VNYARRQQYRRLSHAGKTALGIVVAGLLGLAVAIAGAAALGGVLLLTAVGLGFYARHWLSLAGRSRVGARSEDEVQRALAPLQAEGWRLRHSLAWRGRGDIDSVAVAPTGVAIARRRPGPTTRVTSPACTSRRSGCPGAGEDGAATACSPSSALSECVASSAARTTSWWSRSIV
jgi:hypothetical protein